MTLRTLALIALVSSLLAGQEDRGRPIVLLVHGRGMMDRDTAATRKMWQQALASGARTITAEPLIGDRDVRVVWYADVLDPRSGASCDYASGDPRARRAHGDDADFRSFLGVMGGILGVVTSLVDDSEASTQLRGLAGDASFVADAGKRCASEQRLAAEIDRAKAEGRPIVIVAHSLGAIVAYDYLSARRDSLPVVDRFVTMGSMVGYPELRRLLVGGAADDSLTRPAGVKAWVNLRNGQDVLAAPLSIGRDVVTTPAPDEPDPHEMVGYLRSSSSAREILNGWCAAFTRARPRGCNEVAPK
jgi:pimeloyl-ACP methyl ester carboxylesterase